MDHITVIVLGFFAAVLALLVFGIVKILRYTGKARRFISRRLDADDDNNKKQHG